MVESSEVRVGEFSELERVEGRAERLNQGKPQLSLVMEFRRALEGASFGLEEGVGKYGRGNWRKGMPEVEVVDSLVRHLIAFMSGEDIDPASGLPHVDKMTCNALMLAEYFHTRTDKR